MSTERVLGARRPRATDGLFIVGLIGRAGSGKSTVSAALAENGARVIDADRVGHDVTDRDSKVRAALIAEYGPDVYRPNGTLDRIRVAERVFADPAARERLNRLTHPRLIARIEAALEALRAETFRGIVLIDAALMLDWGLEKHCDVLIAVTAPESTRIERLRESRGWTEEQASARLAAQRPDTDYVAAADVTLENLGTREELAKAARLAIQRLRGASS